MKKRKKSAVPAALSVLGLCLIFAAASVSRHAPPVVASGEDEDTDEQSAPYEAAVLNALSADTHVQYDISSSTPQFVLLSFDGSKSVPMLDEIMAFEQHMKAEGKPINFTYFINGAYFVTASTSAAYQAPGQPVGATNIGYSVTSQDIASRISAFNKAMAEGDEVGSHTAGHFNGATWSYDDWSKEFDSFDSLITHISENNPGLVSDAPAFTPATIVGFRAPYLATDDGMYRALAAHHYAYDASGVNVYDNWPTKDGYGIWHIPLGFIHMSPNPAPIVAMDYNLWTRQSHDTEEATKGTQLWQTYYDDVLTAYLGYFNSNYEGNRAPVVIADHFTKWNDGVYWEAMKAFAENVCGMQNVRCVTFKELTDYLNTTGVPPVIPR